LGVPRPKPPTEYPASPVLPVSAEAFLVFGSASADTSPEPVDPATVDFDPGSHNVDEVKDFVTLYPETTSLILELESNGKDRSTLVDWLIDFDPNG